MGIASELIERGWCQRTLEDDEGRVCLMGALFKAYSWEENAGLHMQACSALISACPTDELVSTWNNAPERTFDEVLRVAKEADELLGAS